MDRELRDDLVERRGRDYNSEALAWGRTKTYVLELAADGGWKIVAALADLMSAPASPRPAAEEALLDAAERLLRDYGYAAITTRRLAQEAGVNHGLVHYYFGSNENLLIVALERFTDGLVARQRELYARDVPFVARWRTAMQFLVSEDAAYEKIWMELQALAWNNDGIRERLARVNAEWRSVLTEAFDQPRRELGIEMPLGALVSLVITFNLGIIVERLGGIDSGHAALLDWIDRWLTN